MSNQREFAAWNRGYKWAENLAAKMGRVASAPINLEPTFIWIYKLEQFEDDDYARDLFVKGYRDYHQQHRSKG
jgi:hypothetical protein